MSLSKIIAWLPLLSLVLWGTAVGQEDAYQPSLLVFPPSGHSWVQKARTAHLKMVLGLGFGFANPQGVACVRLDEGDDPKTVDDDDELTVFAVNSDKHQVVYNQGLAGVRYYGGLGSGKGKLHNPVGVAASPDGLVSVVDMNNNRVVLLRMRKGKLSYVRDIGAGALFHPAGCAFDARGHIFITDSDHGRVAVFDTSGNLISSFGQGLLDRPLAVAMVDGIERWNHRRETYIVVADSASGRLRKFDRLGRLLAQATGDDIAMPGAYFGFLAIDYYGSIYATDMVNHMVHKFDHELKYVASFGRRGEGEREFESPRGIAIWRRYGQVFVLERESAQYYWVGIDGYVNDVSPDTIDSKHPGATISLQLYEPADFKIMVNDASGRTVRTLVSEFRETLGRNYVVWDGNDDTGQPAPPGEYRFLITLEPTYSSKGYFRKELSAPVWKTE
jgi:DNA-binding beta-propeller fold protein YncE